ncbi:unnamed protein product [Amoebophrya sp. A25]|nr:unnamed protein product [Amoebophrya sp. A25]|eukprot:GSA25T00015584001.1
MPRFYCEYCDVYLKCASQGCRKEHNFGRKHINNKIDHYTALIREKQLAPPIHQPPMWLVKRIRKNMASAPGASPALPVPVLPMVPRPEENKIPDAASFAKMPQNMFQMMAQNMQQSMNQQMQSHIAGKGGPVPPAGPPGLQAMQGMPGMPHLAPPPPMMGAPQMGGLMPPGSLGQRAPM